MSAPDLTTKVLGYRRWKIAEGKLHSYGAGDAAWEPGPNAATCPGHDLVVNAGYVITAWQSGAEIRRQEEVAPHSVPGAECGCGFYAYHEPVLPSAGGFAGGGYVTMGTATYGYSPAPVTPEPTKIVGAIAGWGKMEVHETGWRSEMAEVIALGIPDLALTKPELRREVKEMAALYGVPAVPLCDLALEAERHAEPVPKTLYPEKPEPPKAPSLSFSQSFTIDTSAMNTYLTAWDEIKPKRKPWWKRWGR